tara:strand:- start:4256 stop:4450 length:195 start_codon:yes stop_codon:yes gene_type:complete
MTAILRAANSNLPLGVIGLTKVMAINATAMELAVQLITLIPLVPLVPHALTAMSRTHYVARLMA